MRGKSFRLQHSMKCPDSLTFKYGDQAYDTEKGKFEKLEKEARLEIHTKLE